MLIFYFTFVMIFHSNNKTPFPRPPEWFNVIPDSLLEFLKRISTRLKLDKFECSVSELFILIIFWKYNIHISDLFVQTEEKKDKEGKNLLHLVSSNRLNGGRIRKAHRGRKNHHSFSYRLVRGSFVCKVVRFKRHFPISLVEHRILQMKPCSISGNFWRW